MHLVLQHGVDLVVTVSGGPGGGGPKPPPPIPEANDISCFIDSVMIVLLFTLNILTSHCID